MAAFLFQIELPPLTEEIISEIPTHREHINKLFAESKLLNYSVSIGKEYLWCVVNADNQNEALDIVSTFPLRKYFVDITCNPLLFHNTIPASLEAISLN